MKHTHSIILGAIIVWTVAHCILVWNGGKNQVFNWPDANANYHFAHRIYTGQLFAVTLPFEASPETSHLATRSTRVIGSQLVPIGFWGLSIAYGFISRLLFFNVIVYITIIAAALAAYCWYRIVSRLFTPTHGLYATLVLLIHPGWFYYTNESLLPNVVLVSSVLAMVWCVLEYARATKAVYAYMGAILFAVCVMIRPSELLWIVPLMMYIIFTGMRHKKNLSVRVMLYAFGLAALLSIAWLLFQKNIAPQEPLFGYYIPAFEQAHGIWYVWRFIAPFGVDITRIALRVWQYLGMLVWPFVLVNILGFIAMLNRRERNLRALVVAGVVMGGVLLVHYGSGNFVNTPNPRVTSIDASFTRYFLPLHVFSTLFAAYGLVWLSQRTRGRFRNILPAGIFVILLVFSMWLTVFEPVHGIVQKTRVLQGYDRVASYIRSNTPTNALVVTQRGDKYIWPHRLVMGLPYDHAGRQALRAFAIERDVPAYLISLRLTSAGRSELNSTWQPYGLIVGDELMTQDDIGVYTITHSL